MARYPISQEGLAAFGKLKKDLNDLAADIDTQTNALFTAVKTNSDSLGYLHEDVFEYLKEIQRTEKTYLQGVQRATKLIDIFIMKIEEFLSGSSSSGGGGVPQKALGKESAPSEHHYDQGKRFALGTSLTSGIGSLSDLYYSGNYSGLMQSGYALSDQLQIGKNEEFLEALNEDIRYNHSFAETLTEDDLGFLLPYKQAMIRQSPDTARMWEEHDSYENVAALLMVAVASGEGRQQLEEHLPSCMKWFEETLENSDNIGKEKGFAKRKVIGNGQ